MGHEGQEAWLKDLLVFLFAAGIIVPLLRLSRISAVLGFLLAGVVLGPYGLGMLADRWHSLEYVTVTDPAAAAPFAELGVLFLLFLLGLELSFQRLWQLRRMVFGAGAVQAITSATLIGGVLYVLGVDPPAAVTIGLALALSSTAIVMQLLTEEHRVASPAGRTSLSILLFQDILVAPILILVGFFARDAGTSIGNALLEALIQGVIAIAVILILGRFVLRRLFSLAAQAGGRDFLMALTLLVVVGAAILTAGAGLSLALGAFMAGLLLGETEFKHQAEVDLEPFKGLLLGVFFMTVGMSINLASLWTILPLALAGLVGMLVLKGGITIIACRVMGAKSPVAIESAFLLAPAGEFAFVIIAAAVAGQLISPELTVLVTAIAVLSMLSTPIMGRLGQWIAARLKTEGDDTDTTHDLADLKGHVLMAGFGRVGQASARLLRGEDAEIVALERNSRRVGEWRKKGWTIFLGDASRPEILQKVGADGAILFVVTVDDPDSAEAMVRAFRTLRQDAPILARARDVEHAQRLIQAGASFVIPDAIEAGLQLAGRALEEFGLATETVRDLIAHERDEEYARARAEDET